jgi:hypothetical protein
MIRAGRSLVLVPMRSLIFFNSSIVFGLIIILGLTQLLTEISTRKLSAEKMRPERRVGNRTAICEPIV